MLETIACYSPVAGMPLLKITNCLRERRFCVVAETVGKLLEKGKNIKFYSKVLLNLKGKIKRNNILIERGKWNKIE